MQICVGVLSYNSEKTIIETLNSILSQTYAVNKIELIISDDCSEDGTLTIVENWLSEHKDSFFSTSLLKNKTNSGVSNSLNKLINSTKSLWIKPIAADDILAPDCININTKFLAENNSAKLIFSNILKFSNMPNKEKMQRNRMDMKFFQSTSEEQYKSLLYDCKIHAPTAFLNVQFLVDIGGVNQNFVMMEDYPLWLKATLNREKLHAFDEVTVFYRLGESLSQTNRTFGNERYLSDKYNFYKEMIWPQVSFVKQLDDRVMFFSKKALIKFFKNRRNTLSKSIYIATFVLRPFSVYKKIQGFMNGY